MLEEQIDDESLISEFPFSLEIADGFIAVQSGKRLLRIYLIKPTLIRFRYASNGQFERDFSYAVEVCTSNNVAYNIEEDAAHVSIITSELLIAINKANLSIKISNTNGLVVNEDASELQNEFHYENNTLNISLEKIIQEDEHFYGLGDKAEHPDLRNKSFTIWGHDQYGYYRHTDPLYKNIPFYIGLHSGISYGIFIDNTFKSHFDFGKKDSNLCNVMVEGGEMNYYFIYGPEMVDVTAQYTILTGVPELPPLWALGYHQCKWSYYPQAQVVDICDQLRAKEIPCDAIYLDIDYMDGFRCFTWDREKFPSPKKMVADLKDKGFKTIVIIDPGIKIDENYPIYIEALEKGYFCKAGEGGYISGRVWPGECLFPDFTNAAVRYWWADLFKELILDIGIKGIWTDMNEPALFDVPNKTFPNDVRHDFDGLESSHRKAHNVYGQQMSKATYEGVKKYVYPERPFVITRSTYSGGQRYASVWTGDNIASWDHLWIANVQTQRLSISGFSFAGSDIGGFIDAPSPELYVRWIQLAVMHPFFRTHSSGDHGDQEPWSFGEEALIIVRKFIGIRYKFLPYIYSTFYKYVKFGLPMLRPIYMYDQADSHTHYRADEVLHGEQVLYAPVLEEGAISKTMYFPKGQWYNYWTNEKFEGGREHEIDVPLDQSPLFVKAGAIMPQYPVMSYVGEKEIVSLDLLIYFVVGSEKSFLYEDAGNGYDYKNGGFNEKYFLLKGGASCLEITQEIIGSFNLSYETYTIHLIGMPFSINKIVCDGQIINGWNNHFEVSADFRKININ